MTLSLVGTDVMQQVEEQLWSRNITAQLNEQRIQLQYEKAWRLHVMCGDSETGEMWDVLAEKWRQARDHADEVRREWQRVAYPLYGWPLPNED